MFFFSSFFFPLSLPLSVIERGNVRRIVPVTAYGIVDFGDRHQVDGWHKRDRQFKHPGGLRETVHQRNDDLRLYRSQ